MTGPEFEAGRVRSTAGHGHRGWLPWPTSQRQRPPGADGRMSCAAAPEVTWSARADSRGGGTVEKAYPESTQPPVSSSRCTSSSCRTRGPLLTSGCGRPVLSSLRERGEPLLRAATASESRLRSALGAGRRRSRDPKRSIRLASRGAWGRPRLVGLRGLLAMVRQRRCHPPGDLRDRLAFKPAVTFTGCLRNRDPRCSLRGRT